MALQFAADQQRHVVHDVGQGDRHIGRIALARQGAQPAHDLAGALAVLDHVLDRAARLADVGHGAPEPAQAGLAVGDDGGQRLVDLMGDRGGELAQGGDARDMGELALGALQAVLDLACAR